MSDGVSDGTSNGIAVVGGVGGVEVEYADLLAAARVLQAAAVDLAETATSAGRALGSATLLASSVLDPGGFARADAAVLAAVAGPHGIAAVAARLESRSLLLREAVVRYDAADRLQADLRQTRQWAEGITAGLLAPMLPFVALSPVGLVAGVALRRIDVNALLAEHPGVAQDVAGATPGFLDTFLLVGLGPLALTGRSFVTSATGRPAFVTSLEEAAGLVGAMYPAGRLEVGGRGTDTSAPPPPRGIGDLLAALDHRDASSRGAAQGEIDVRRLTHVDADGTVRTSWVVDLPGTKEWQPDPRRREHLNDLATNLTTMAGDPSPRVDGLTLALERAGVGRDEPVMLVGHSQGGLVAMRAAEQYASTGQFAVTHVVTAGSPTARMTVPASVSVLALENRFDLVPQLDGSPPPPEPNRVTVLFDRQTSDVGDNHALTGTYLPAARRVDDDLADPSLAGWRDTAGVFFDADEVQTSVWDIRNR